jgi:hypothetical protein
VELYRVFSLYYKHMQFFFLRKNWVSWCYYVLCFVDVGNAKKPGTSSYNGPKFIL